MTRKKQTGLGKGLDSLIPKVYDENFDSNNPISLEDMLGENKPAKINESGEEEKADENNVKDDEPVVDDSQEETSNEDLDNKTDDEPVVESADEEKAEEIKLTKKELAHIAEVKEVVAKNPRITLWSARSAAVFRYLRKTEPEFSISKEASLMIEEAVSEKYPEIWKLFEED